MSSPFDLINIINEKRAYDRPDVISDYEPWIINRGFSNMMDTVFFAAEMSRYSHLAKDIQFDFYYHGIPKGKRFGKWHKKDNTEKDLINTLKQVFSCNDVLAKKYLALLSDNDIKELLEIEGGK